VQSILQQIQAQSTTDQVISARLLPSQGESPEVTPVDLEDEAEAEVGAGAAATG
jgi:hypothetical protein